MRRRTSLSILPFACCPASCWQVAERAYTRGGAAYRPGQASNWSLFGKRRARGQWPVMLGASSDTVTPGPFSTRAIVGRGVAARSASCRVPGMTREVSTERQVSCVPSRRRVASMPALALPARHATPAPLTSNPGTSSSSRGSGGRMTASGAISRPVVVRGASHRTAGDRRGSRLAPGQPRCR
jgi:hypothetical protein